VPEELIERSRLVYSTGITQSISASARGAVKKAFTIAKEKKSLVAYDPNFRERLWDIGEAKEALEEVVEMVDIMILSVAHDAQKILGISSPDKIIKYFWDRGTTIIMVKMGHAGSVVGYNGEISLISPRKVETLDTTGTGDAFNGGFLHGITKGYTPFESAKLATIVASEQSKGIGAIKSVPAKDKVYAEFKKGDFS
jgi:2-dehydro-3-deoxygluconokinase